MLHTPPRQGPSPELAPVGPRCRKLRGAVVVHDVPDAAMLLEAVGGDEGIHRLVHELFERDPGHRPDDSTPHVPQLELVPLAPAKDDAPVVDDGVVPAEGEAPASRWLDFWDLVPTAPAKVDALTVEVGAKPVGAWIHH